MFSKIISKYISKLKGQSYLIDHRIPDSYLLGLIASRIMMKIRGIFSFIQSPDIPFVGRSVTLKARSKIKAGKALSIGNRCYIDALSVEGITLGSNVSIGNNTKIECTGNIQHLGKGFRAGNNVGLGSDNFYGCAGGISIDDDTIIGNFVSFHSENHIFTEIEKPIRLQGVSHKGISVGKNCWIGAKATILDGSVIEDGCIIAAGAVVLAGTYKQNGIFGGVPAKLIKYRDDPSHEYSNQQQHK